MEMIINETMSPCSIPPEIFDADIAEVLIQTWDTLIKRNVYKGQRIPQRQRDKKYGKDEIPCFDRTLLTWNITERPVNEMQNEIIKIECTSCEVPAFITPQVISNSEDAIVFAICKV